MSDPSRAAGRGPGGALLLLALGIVLAAALGEIVARVLWQVRPPATAAPPVVARAPILAPDGAPLPEIHRVRDLKRPGVRAINAGVYYRTNRAGFRGPDVSLRPAPGVFRVVVAGDSIVMGHGVPERDAYPAQLGPRLEGRAVPKVQVLNLGLSGLHLSAVVKRVEQIGLAHHPDLLVYGFTPNDIKGPEYEALGSEAGAAEHLARHRRFADSPSFLLRSVWPRWVALSDLLFRPPGSVGHEVHHNYFENPAAWRRFTSGLDALAGFGRSEGICVVLLIHTHLAQLDWLHPFLDVYGRVADAARARGIEVVESFPQLRGRDPTELRLGYVDTHPNAAGHALLADVLAAGLLALPSSCWEGRAGRYDLAAGAR